VADSIGLLNQIGPVQPGQTVTLGVLRDGKELDVPVKVGMRPQVRK
jgi:serine protease DegQ